MFSFLVLIFSAAGQALDCGHEVGWGCLKFLGIPKGGPEMFNAASRGLPIVFDSR